MATIAEVLSQKHGIESVRGIVVAVQVRTRSEAVRKQWQRQEARTKELRSARLWLVSELGIYACDEVAAMQDADVMELYSTRKES